MGDLLHGDETRVWGDSAYSGQTEVLEEMAPMAKDFTQKKGSRYRKLTDAHRASNRNKSKVRAKVEHVFGIMKRQFGYHKVRYKGLDKNAHAVFTKCALVKQVTPEICDSKETIIGCLTGKLRLKSVFTS